MPGMSQASASSKQIARVTVQSGRPSGRIAISEAARQEVRAAYLASQRQRFRMEVVRLTRGGMLDILRKKGVDADEAERLAFLMAWLFAWHWLQRNVHADYQAEVLATFRKGAQGFLIDMLLASDSAESFVNAYIDYWRAWQGPAMPQQQQLRALLEAQGGAQALVAHVLDRWRRLGLLQQSFAEAYKDLAREEKQRYASMLDDNDRQRLALVDALPEVTPPARFSKLGLIPAMGCPQTCRHCMFIFRPLMKNADDPEPLFRMVDALTESVLFTGGDLSRHLHHFYRAIGSMPHVSTFAILLNGDFADSREATVEVLEKMAAAIRRRPSHWARAKVMLQISFDEFHQEVVVNRKGELAERIPVTKIAHIVENAPRYSDAIQLCLLHKQVSLNFSTALFEQGVFARLVNELGRRGHQVRVLSSAPAPRLKRNPASPEKPAPLIRDATFVLARYPEVHMLLTSTTIDAYGRANEMELHEAVNERDLLAQVLAGKGAGGETFDTDLMFWFNGWATLFSAVHMCLGNVFDEGMDTIRQRQAKDPLSQALHDFDLRLLDFYREKRDDLDAIIERSTSPHHLFHTLTESSEMRLHMTRRLLED